MRLTTITRALAALPATREELAERLGVKEGQASAIARELLGTHQAEEWGSRLTSRGGRWRLFCKRRRPAMSRSARTRRDKRAPQPDFDDTTAAYGRFSFGSEE